MDEQRISTNAARQWQITMAVLGMLTVAFAAWGGIVYSLGNTAISKLDGLRTQVAVIEAEQRIATRITTEHLSRPWHNEAGELLTRVSAQLKNIEDRLDRSD